MSPDMQEVQRDMIDAQSERTKDKQDELRKRYEKEIENLKKEVVDGIEGRLNQITSTRNRQIKRIRELIAYQAKIEIEIQDKLQELSILYGQIRTELESVVEWVREDVKAGIERVAESSSKEVDMGT